MTRKPNEIGAYRGDKVEQDILSTFDPSPYPGKNIVTPVLAYSVPTQGKAADDIHRESLARMCEESQEGYWSPLDGIEDLNSEPYE